MKILRSDEWEPAFWVENFPGLGKAYIFKSKTYGDIMALKVAKYIVLSENNSYIYDAETRKVCLRADNSETTESQLPVLRVQTG